jgi:cell division transport system permease protein
MDLLLGDNPLHNSYEVTLGKEHAQRASVDEFVAAVKDVEGVEYVAVPPVDVVENMHDTLSYITIGLLAFLAVLLIISLLLLNNTIRLAIYSKRYLINTMKLVGATKWYIMRPLLNSALKQGIIAGIVAAVMVVGVVYGANSFTPEGLTMLNYTEVGIIVGALVVVGVVITTLFSAFAVNKFVNMKSNKIYLY